MQVDDAQIAAQIVECLAARDERSSCCPSEIARALAPVPGAGWRLLMPRVLSVAAQLVDVQRICVTRGSRELTDGDFGGGPIRLRRGQRFSPDGL